VGCAKEEVVGRWKRRRGLTRNNCNELGGTAVVAEHDLEHTGVEA